MSTAGVQSLGLACPYCLKDKTTPREVPLKTSPGKFGYFCDNGHMLDTEALRVMDPPKLAAAAARPMPATPGFRKVEVVIPDTLADSLVARFGARLPATLASVLGSLLDAGAFIVGGADAARLTERLGVKVTNSSQLAGIVFALKTEHATQAEELAALKSTTASLQAGKVGGGTGLWVEMTGTTLEKVTQKAQFQSTTPGFYLSQQIPVLLENGGL